MHLHSRDGRRTNDWPASQLRMYSNEIERRDVALQSRDPRDDRSDRTRSSASAEEGDFRVTDSADSAVAERSHVDRFAGPPRLTSRPVAPRLDNRGWCSEPARPLNLSMANTKSAAKRARQSVKRMRQNRASRSRLRTLHKGTRGDGVTQEKIRALVSALDKAAKRGVIHRNAANRRKARLNKLVAAAGPKK